jgi:hypothetical protein
VGFDTRADMFAGYGHSETAQVTKVHQVEHKTGQFRACFAMTICGPSWAFIMSELATRQLYNGLDYNRNDKED